MDELARGVPLTVELIESLSLLLSAAVGKKNDDQAADRIDQ